MRTQRDAPRRRSTTLPRAPRQLQTQARSSCSRRVSADALVLTSALNAAQKRTTASARRDSVRKQKAATGGGAAACCSLSLYLGEPARDMFVVDPSTTQSFVYNLLHPDSVWDTVEIKVHCSREQLAEVVKTGTGFKRFPKPDGFDGHSAEALRFLLNFNQNLSVHVRTSRKGLLLQIQLVMPSKKKFGPG